MGYSSNIENHKLQGDGFPFYNGKKYSKPKTATQAIDNQQRRIFKLRQDLKQLCRDAGEYDALLEVAADLVGRGMDEEAALSTVIAFFE